MESKPVYVICRKLVDLRGYVQINTIKELKSIPSGTEVILAGPIPLHFQEKNAMLKVAQEHNLILRAIH